MDSLELFVGAGGLALGAARAGFKHSAVIDWDDNACQTLRRNRAHSVEHVEDWEIIQDDVTTQDFKSYARKIDVVFGGPPCQPFSFGGKHRGHDDYRNMFPQAVRAIREIQPKAFIFENVRGLLRPSFKDYFNYITQQLRFPDVQREAGENWGDHFARLKKLHVIGQHPSLNYNVVHECFNAADFGVPQNRQRVFWMATRADLGLELHFPQQSHTRDVLLHDQWVTGKYWERHGIAKSRRPNEPIRLKQRIEQLRLGDVGETLRPWRTVRDAICDLPKADIDQTSSNVQNHFVNPGARSYLGHDGSIWDGPAKTLKAGDHGVPGGENPR